MVTRDATDEGPLQESLLVSSDESGTGRSDSPSDNSEPEANIVVPPDGGWGWAVVAASFVCNFLVDGIILSGGTILECIQKDFQVTAAKAAPISALLTGFYLLAGPFVSALANKYGFRIVTIAGSLLSSAAFCLSYFATSVEYLYIVYGVIGGIGFCMIYMPAVLTVGFYFEKWRALATGIALCGSGVGTFVFAPLSEAIKKNMYWKYMFFVQAGFALICIFCGATFRPIKPVRVTLADQPTEEDIARRHEEAVEKLNSMIKLQENLDNGKISMSPETKFSSKDNPHTWMGVASNKRYPTAEEVFRASNSNLNRRSSANSAVLKNGSGKKPTIIAVPVVEKDEQDDNSNDNKQPLIITPTTKIVPVDNSKTTKVSHSHADLYARPLYRDDIFFGASLNRLPQYTSRSSLAYHLAVTHVPTKAEKREEKSKRYKICSEAIKRTLTTMLDFNLMKSPTVLILSISGFFTMMGYLIPFLYLKSRGELNGMSESAYTFLVPAVGISNLLGRIGCGMISSLPKVSPLWVNNIALTIGGIAILVSGLTYNGPYQFICAILFGLAIACWASLRSIIVVEYVGLEQLTNCFGLFLLFQGLGALLGAPLAGALKDASGNYDNSFYLAGSFFLLSALMCYPIDYVSQWEKNKKKVTATPDV